VLVGIAAMAVALGAARWYQGNQVRRLFNAYIAAPKTPLADAAGPLLGVPSGEWPQYLEVDLNTAACGPTSSVTFRYDRAQSTEDFTRTIAVGRRASGPGTTRIFLPVFERFTGVELADASAGCLTGAYRFPDLTRFRLLLGATLPPDWESAPLYQRLGT
jgi:hypothetical protein